MKLKYYICDGGNCVMVSEGHIYVDQEMETKGIKGSDPFITLGIKGSDPFINQTVAKSTQGFKRVA